MTTWSAPTPPTTEYPRITGFPGDGRPANIQTKPSLICEPPSGICTTVTFNAWTTPTPPTTTWT